MKKPQVLLLGNGLNRAFGGVSWDNLLEQIAVPDKKAISKKLSSPFPLKAILVTENHIKEGLKKIEKELYGSVESEKLREILQKVLLMEFDHILTTNYSYELEIAAKGKKNASKYYLNSIADHTKAVESVEKKYLLHSFNQCTYENVENKVWHIHGEAKKQDSIILGHYYYGNLFSRMKEELNKKGNYYQEKQKAGEDIEITSWIDAFILGDVHVLGFGYDSCEFDLWWLLNRKVNEKANKGKVYFYTMEPAGFDEKLALLDVLEVKMKHCDMKVPVYTGAEDSEEEYSKFKEERDETYRKFYETALNEIESYVAAEKFIDL